jgi:hypothetical protein
VQVVTVPASYDGIQCPQVGTLTMTMNITMTMTITITITITVTVTVTVAITITITVTITITITMTMPMTITISITITIIITVTVTVPGVEARDCAVQQGVLQQLLHPHLVSQILFSEYVFLVVNVFFLFVLDYLTVFDHLECF